MSDCTHDCSSCGENCAERQGESPFQIKPLREGCRVGKVYGVVSGKGGVGKSMVTSQRALYPQGLRYPWPGRRHPGRYPPRHHRHRHPADEREPAAGARD